MKKAILIILLVVVVILGIHYLVSKHKAEVPADDMNGMDMTPSASTSKSGSNKPGTTGTPSTPSTLPDDTSSAPTPVTATVNIQYNAFTPSPVTVAKGGKVTWINHDTVSHTVTSDAGGVLASGTLAPGATYTYTFLNTGTFSYHCDLHPSMKGSVTVVAN